MKKYCALLLAVLLCFLVACGQQGSAAPTQPTTNPDEPPMPAPTQPKPPANVGDILQVPDAAATFEEVTEYEVFRVDITDAYYDHFIYAWEYNFATGTTVMYIYDEYEGEEIINVIKRDQVTRYFRLIGEESFVLDYEADEADWTEDKDIFTAMMKTLTQYSLPTEDILYRKLGEMTATAGEAVAYEIIDQGALYGYLYIDKTTGILSALANETGNITALITAISTENANIPQYK